MRDPTKRFSKVVENYVRYRPSYPAEIISLLTTECGLTSQSLIADIGSGPGFLSELFLSHGNRVVGVEPNAQMRAAGEQLLKSYSNFTSVTGTAEATTLADHSIDFVTAGQAFHWFDRGKARREFARILKPKGYVAIVWNTFAVERSELVKGYDEVLLRYGTDYRDVRSEIEDSDIQAFFSPAACRRARFNYQQIFDWESFKGRLLSASYAPQAGDPNFEPMLDELRKVFDANQTDGKVVFDYDTEVYYGRLEAD